MPAHNLYIGKFILEQNDDNLNRFYTEEIKDDPKWQSYFGTRPYTLADASSFGLVIIIDDKMKINQRTRNELYKALPKYDTKSIPQRLYFLTQKQYDEIQKMKKSGKYIHSFDYIAQKDNGQIKGRVLNIINVKGKMVRTKAYIADLIKIGNAEILSKM